VYPFKVTLEHRIVQTHTSTCTLLLHRFMIIIVCQDDSVTKTWAHSWTNRHTAYRHIMSNEDACV